MCVHTCELHTKSQYCNQQSQCSYGISQPVLEMLTGILCHS